ncbi:hypothetical protein D3OALGA1CA_16 [Olavius algarvensis associated proteobacterium Delta 3]|nr:hypothetical protein D3OALGA1CA_16 [Olavius algarvensis associated proteobacterium Delta 3]CAB5099400.1 hypothetical protein D3OALGB2SA_1731 [Olavius algarvensis associated proteobacterium Delta 3]
MEVMTAESQRAQRSCMVSRIPERGILGKGYSYILKFYTCCQTIVLHFALPVLFILSLSKGRSRVPPWRDRGVCPLVLPVLSMSKGASRASRRVGPPVLSLPKGAEPKGGSRRVSGMQNQYPLCDLCAFTVNR